MNELKSELKNIASDIDELQSKLKFLKQQEKETLKEINELEEDMGLEGYLQMKESMLNSNFDENNANNHPENNGQEDYDFDEISRKIESLQQTFENFKSASIMASKEVRILREDLQELESDFEMKKRIYNSAAAGLEAELSRSEAELERLVNEYFQLESDRILVQSKLLAIETESDQLFGPSNSEIIIEQLKADIENETVLQKRLIDNKNEWKQKENYYRQQIEMWRDLRAIFEVKTKLLGKKLESKNQIHSMDGNLDHLVLDN
ncbi:intraflagellar transport 81-like protein [Sarcoptes scabiei]|nr:intraflagellar transport 81-like protein [Sarcoptes scabiei]